MVDETQVHHHDPVCTLCNTRKSKHHNRVHPFSDPDSPLSPTQVFGKTPAGRTGGSGKPLPSDKASVEHSVFPFDPVLRIALIGKGILEPEDITRAEQILKASGQFPELLEGTKVMPGAVNDSDASRD